MKDIVVLSTPELVGAGFRFLYSGEFGPSSKCVVASWNGDKSCLPRNCRFVKDSDDNPDYSQIVIPLDATRLPKHGRIKVTREFRVHDSDFADGFNNIRIEGWVGETDHDSTPVQSTIVINAMRGESTDKTVITKVETDIQNLRQDLEAQQALNSQQQQDIAAQQALNDQQQTDLDEQRQINIRQQAELDDIEPIASESLTAFFTPSDTP